MVHFLHLMPLEPRWVLYRFLELRFFLAVSDDIKPIAISPVFGPIRGIGS
jgi:hypothetical protein